MDIVREDERDIVREEERYIAREEQEEQVRMIRGNIVVLQRVQQIQKYTYCTCPKQYIGNHESF